MEWNTETQRHKDTELYFLREQSSQSKSPGSMVFTFSIYLFLRASVPLCSI